MALLSHKKPHKSCALITLLREKCIQIDKPGQKGTQHRCFITVLLSLHLFVTNIVIANDNTDDTEHSLALSQARKGDYSTAIPKLMALAAKQLLPNRFYYDYLVVLSWAEQYKEVAESFAKINLQQAPSYVLKTLGFALRKQQQFFRSKRTYQALHSRYPEVNEYRIALALVNIDQHKRSEARDLLMPIYTKDSQNIDLLHALAYLEESSKDFVKALHYHQRVLEMDETDQESTRQRVLLLRKAGAPLVAKTNIQNTAYFSPLELAKLESDIAATKLKWGGNEQIDGNHRYAEIDEAIALIKQNIVTFKAQFGTDHKLYKNEIYDLLLAYRDRVEMETVIETSESFTSDISTIPIYARSAVCEAYLYLERTKNAVNCYKNVIDDTTNVKNSIADINAKIGLYYALLESEETQDAKEWIEHVSSQVNANVHDDAENIINDKSFKTDLLVISSFATAFADDMQTAEQVFLKLHEDAPYNTEIREGLASIYYWRGWTDKALAEYEIGLHQEPDNIYLKLGLARNYLDSGDKKKAEELIQDLTEEFSDNKHVKRLALHCKLMKRPELVIDLSTDKGTNREYGDRSLAFDTRFYSSPMKYNYRLFGHFNMIRAKIDNSTEKVHKEGVGIEYTSPKVGAEVEVHNTHYTKTKVSVDVSGSYKHDDHVTVGAAYQSVSSATPLKAYINGIDAKSISGMLNYRWHESRTFGIDFSKMDFSDNNERSSVNINYNHRWRVKNNFRFWTNFEGYASKNTSKDAPYFNPKKDRSLVGVLDLDWMSFRRYETTLNQRLVFTGGRYHQEGFEDGGIWSAKYEHRWTKQKKYDIVYGITRASRRYDGDNELSWGLYLHFNRRL